MIPVYHDFSKRDKKVITNLITSCVSAEIAHFVQQTQADYHNLTNSTDDDLRPAYWNFAEKMHTFSKHLTKRYDNTAHRDYPLLIIRLLAEEISTEDILVEISDSGKEKIRAGVAVLRSF